MISHRGSLLAIVLVVLVPTSGLTQARLVQGDPAQNRASQQAQTGRPLQPQPANPELTDPEKVTELMALIGELNKWLDSRKDAKNNAAGVLPDAQASLNKLKLRGVRLSGQKRVIDNAAWVASTDRRSTAATRRSKPRPGTTSATPSTSSNSSSRRSRPTRKRS